jgi:hypothetical protein
VSGVGSELISTTKAPLAPRDLRQRSRRIDQRRHADHGTTSAASKEAVTASSGRASPNHTTPGRSSAPQSQRGGISAMGTRRSSRS